MPQTLPKTCSKLFESVVRNRCSLYPYRPDGVELQIPCIAGSLIFDQQRQQRHRHQRRAAPDRVTARKAYSCPLPVASCQLPAACCLLPVTHPSNVEESCASATFHKLLLPSACPPCRIYLESTGAQVRCLRTRTPGSSGSTCGNQRMLTEKFCEATGSARSSVDESRGDSVNKEDETVVDAEQGSSTS